MFDLTNVDIIDVAAAIGLITLCALWLEIKISDSVDDDN